MSEWKCPICNDIRYETVQSEKVKTVDGKIAFVGRKHYCKGCSVLFRDPYLFNKEKIKKDKK